MKAARFWLLLLAVPLAFVFTIILFGVPSGLDIHSSQAFSHTSSPALPSKQPFWLAATISAAHDLQRRTIVRATWQSLYHNDSLFVPKFVLSAPGSLWESVIAHENATYGDIIILPHLNETRRVANTVKTVEFLKYLVDRSRTAGERWAFVSKIDDDSFVDARNFARDYLLPRLDPLTHRSTVNRTIIGRRLAPLGFPYPGGQFYTMTWDTVELLAALHDANPLADVDEDMLVGRLLHDAGEDWDLVQLPNHIAYDYDDGDARGDGTAWAPEGADLNEWVHAVGPGSLNPHKMREDEAYLRVAACFDINGLKPQ